MAEMVLPEGEDHGPEPMPTADQLDPFHLAIFFALTPPTLEKYPPA
jgi:hypothetical protein